MKIGLVIFTVGLCAIACKSSSSGPAATTTASGAGGSDTTTTTGAGGTTAAGGSGGAGGGCQGDQAEWAKLTAGPIACTKNSDCCVIINGCISAAQIVGAADEAAAKVAWPTCQSQCNDCIPPAIEVGCKDGECAGTVVDFQDASSDLKQDHCGVDATVVVDKSKLLFGCGG